MLLEDSCRVAGKDTVDKRRSVTPQDVRDYTEHTVNSQSGLEDKYARVAETQGQEEDKRIARSLRTLIRLKRLPVVHRLCGRTNSLNTAVLAQCGTSSYAKANGEIITGSRYHTKYKNLRHTYSFSL